MPNQLTLRAYAKVNLVLDVLRRRPDGYHDVRMVMQNLDLCDFLTFTIDDNWSVPVENMDADCDSVPKNYKITIHANREDIPTDAHNLVYKAIAKMFEMFHISSAIHVKLEKNIPVEAGMAGGSTDCAAAIKAVNRMYGLGLSLQEMMDIGVTLGADVPYCIMASTALSEGIGEVLTRVTPLSGCYVLVAKPKVRVSTAMVYKNLRLDAVDRHPNVDGMLAGLAEGNLDTICANMENILETVTTVMYPEIEALKDAMKQNGARNAIMSGSGPTVFGIFDDREAAAKAGDIIRRKGLANEVYVTVPVSEGTVNR